MNLSDVLRVPPMLTTDESGSLSHCHLGGEAVITADAEQGPIGLTVTSAITVIAAIAIPTSSVSEISSNSTTVRRPVMAFGRLSGAPHSARPTLTHIGHSSPM